MGTWGIEPCANDGSHDIASDLDGAAVLALAMLFKRPARSAFSRWERVGAAQIISERGTFLPRDIVEACVRDLEACSRDEEWLAGWRSPSEVSGRCLRRAGSKFQRMPIRKAIEALLKALRATLERATGGCRRRRGRGGSRPKALVFEPIFGYETSRTKQLVEAGMLRRLKPLGKVQARPRAKRAPRKAP